MNPYKKLNEELVQQVQTMKIEIAALRGETNYLREGYFDQHRMRMEMKQDFLRKMTENFLATMKAIDPEINVSNLLPQNKKTGSERFSEFRRSTSLIQRPSLNTSPRRRRSLYSGGEEENKENETRPSMPLQQENGRLGIVVERDEPEEPSSTEEASDISNSELSCMSIEEQSTCQVAARQSDSDSSLQSLNKTVLELQSMEMSPSSENDSEPQPCFVTLRQKKIIPEASMETVRKDLTQDLCETVKSLCLEEDDCIKSHLSVDSPTDFANFFSDHCPSCSTPFSENKKKDCEHLKENLNNTSNLTTTLSRPRRACTPTNLKELSGRYKYRNDNGKTVICVKKENRKN